MSKRRSANRRLRRDGNVVARSPLLITGVARPGVVLIIVLVVIVTLSLSAYTFSRLMLTHRHAAKLTGQQLQARLLVDSGVEMVKYFLLQDELSRQEMGGHFNNPSLFQGIAVVPDEDLSGRGSFAVLSPLGDSSSAATANLTMGSGVRYGLEDESTRLNLNLVLLAGDSARDLLMGIPGMTEDIADAILDWMDDDDTPRDFGAEFDYYASLNPPYEPRNGPLVTVEELLLVRGVTPDLLFGQDQNRNTMSDAHELGGGGGGAGGTATMATAATASLGMTSHRGISSFLTIYSAERNMTAEGLPRVNVNGDDLTQLHADLTDAGFSADWANFIVAYRIAGPYNGEDPGASPEEIEIDLDSSPSASAQIAHLLDLVGAKVEMQTEGSGGGQQTRVYNSPFQESDMLTYLHVLMDTCTAVDAEVIPGRINVNEASPEILIGVPGMTQEIVERLIQQREILSGDLTARNHETWLLAEAVVTLDEMKSLSPFLCAGGDVYRAQVVGYYQGGGPSTRIEVVFDATAAQPRIVLWRDISHLGRGYPLEMLGVDLTGAN